MKQGWEIKKLGEITEQINGLWIGKNPPFVTIAVIRNTNFTKDCNLDTNNIAYIQVEQKQYSTRKLKCGDIIIEKSGGSDKQPVGRPILFNIEDGEYSFSNFTSVLRVVDNTLISPKFLHKFLVYAYNQGYTLNMQSKTTGIRNLNFKLYKNMNVPVPERAEQERIVGGVGLFERDYCGKARATARTRHPRPINLLHHVRRPYHQRQRLANKSIRQCLCCEST